MFFFPILKAPNACGFTTLCNFSPNNWEVGSVNTQIISLTYASNGAWHSHQLGSLNNNEYRAFDSIELEKLLPKGEMPLLSLSHVPLPSISEEIPILETLKTTTPAWRATLGLRTKHTSTSYQGELPVFPSGVSFLSFPPFFQHGEGVENYALLCNVEKDPTHREAEVRIYNTKDKVLLGTRIVVSNQINVIPLDDIGINEKILPVMSCRDMAFVPIYFSMTKDGNFLSLEHTHPPASLVTHGDRFGAQKHLKKLWLSQLLK
jgi:hypothetical protein